MNEETDQPQDDARKTDNRKQEAQQNKEPSKKLTIQEYFNQHVCANIDNDRPCRQLRRRGAPCTKCQSAQNMPNNSPDEQPEPIKTFARPERSVKPVLSGDPDKIFRQLSKEAGENYLREQKELLRPKPPPRDWTPLQTDKPASPNRLYHRSRRSA